MSDRRPLEAALGRLFEKRGHDAASWFALTGGERLFAAGEPADTLYLLRSGRLGVFRQNGDEAPNLLGVIRPGEPVGEMALLTGEPHSSTVIALRDSEVVALPGSAFFDLVRHEPDLLVELSRLIVRRARSPSLGGAEPTVFGFVGLRDRPIRPMVDRLAAAVMAMGFTVRVIGSSALASAAEWFSHVEDDHDFVLYCAEKVETSWASLCARQVDRLFLVGDTLTAPPATLPFSVGLAGDVRRPLTDLILVRPPSQSRPANGRVWLDAIDPWRWFHVTEGSAGDAARMARVITGTAVALVLSGGGARAYAHLGAMDVLREAGAHFDFLGGASMGAVIAAGEALGWSVEEQYDHIRRGFVESNPLDDIAFPIVAMTRAAKVERLVEEAYGDTDMADLCLPFYCVSSNLTRGAVKVHRRGLLRKAIRATISLPGVMPPVVDRGEVLVDGAVLDNFPTRTMRTLTRGPIIGVDLSEARGVDAATLEHPPSWARWLFGGEWKKGTPIVAVLMRAATITTDAELEVARRETDLLIQPKPDGVDIRDWKGGFEPALAAGRIAAEAALANLDVPVGELGLERRLLNVAGRRGTAEETEATSDHPPTADKSAKAARPGRKGKPPATPDR